MQNGIKWMIRQGRPDLGARLEHAPTAIQWFKQTPANWFAEGLEKLIERWQKWYFGNTKRAEAEKKLLLPENDHGAFLIRDSESRPNDYSLSVKDGDTVKHYRIRQLDGGKLFIGKRITFRTLKELVDHYSNDADGLCVNLRKTCVEVRYSVIRRMTNAEVLHQVEHGYRMPAPSGCPPTLYEIMLECWHKDPLCRPTFETLQWKLEEFFNLEGSEYKEASQEY
ncbi:unnamed protein product [Darwinula stevensoni]|uniref:Tyrosine-protein kinase n=1 Tax=Darwinula stevensoni TaxID=69355 RepID=A0A7R8XEG9_9CRUS|nr:unnamed protein product [Darwinula stevensoni]CAG0895290.1 unnamed protein product [Darwinula stevensoni]